MKVQIHQLTDGQDTIAGELRLQHGRIVAAPPSALLYTILEGPVRDPDTGAPVFPEDEPEAFLKNLKYTYRSAYLRAGPVEE